MRRTVDVGGTPVSLKTNAMLPIKYKTIRGNDYFVDYVSFITYVTTGELLEGADIDLIYMDMIYAMAMVNGLESDYDAFWGSIESSIMGDDELIVTIVEMIIATMSSELSERLTAHLRTMNRKRSRGKGSGKYLDEKYDDDWPIYLNYIYMISATKVPQALLDDMEIHTVYDYFTLYGEQQARLNTEDDKREIMASNRDINSL
jgi:hypothetical protein